MRVLRTSRLSLALPASWVESETGSVVIAGADRATLGDAVEALAAAASADVLVALVVPLSRDGAAGVLARTAAWVRRVAPVAMEDACAALRHAGVVSVRVIDVAGVLGLAVIVGRATAP